jgi:hypothetical protein
MIFLSIPMSHHSVHNSQLLTPMLSQITPTQVIQPYFYNIHNNISVNYAKVLGVLAFFKFSDNISSIPPFHAS